jgi:hypothetical protein
MKLTSPSFADGAALPFESAYEARNRSPALCWSGAPSGVRSLALVCQDSDGPDGRPWTHWLLWNIPATETRLPAGLPQYPRLEDGMEQGLNDYLEYGWCGPCPPFGLHEYTFSLYALSATIVPAAPTSGAVLAAIAASTVESARLTAVYGAEGPMPSLAAMGRAARAAFRLAR